MSIETGLGGGENVDKETINIAKRVKDARKSVKLTQSEFGEIIGKSKQWVSELERETIKPRRLQHAPST